MTSLAPYLAGALWFVVAYTALGFFSDSSLFHSLRHLRTGGGLDHRVQLLLGRSERSQQAAGHLKRLLAGSTFGAALGIVHFLLLSLILALTLFVLGILLLNNPLAGALLAAVGLALPYQLLEIDYALTRRRLRRQGTSFLLTVLNLYAVYPDPLAALEHAGPQLPNPIGDIVRWFTTAARHGMPLSECVATVQVRMPDPTLKAFWDDVAFYIQRGGPFNEAIADHVTQLYEREQLASERSVATGSTLAVFGMLVGVYGVLLSGLTRINPSMVDFMLNTGPGRLIVTVMLAIFIGAGYYLKVMTLQGGDH